MQPALPPVNFRDRRKASRIQCPPGQMPSNWDDLTNAQKAQFTQSDRIALKAGDFLWAPDAPEHGVWNSYNNWHCRCPNCKRANTEVKAQGRAGQE